MEKKSSDDKTFVILTSRDGYDIYLDKEVAQFSEVLAARLRGATWNGKMHQIKIDDVTGEVLEVVIQYLHFKARYIDTDFNNNPNVHFNVNPDLALEVLKASIILKV
jgi:Skp1 family, tetramerisation domain